MDCPYRTQASRIEEITTLEHPNPNRLNAGRASPGSSSASSQEALKLESNTLLSFASGPWWERTGDSGVSAARE